MGFDLRHTVSSLLKLTLRTKRIMGFDLGHTVSSLSKLILRTKRKTDKDKRMKDFSVNIFFGKDKMLRFVPGVKKNLEFMFLYQREWKCNLIQVQKKLEKHT